MLETPAHTFADLVGAPTGSLGSSVETHGTTVMAVRYDEGVLLVADRRATAGNLIMFDQAEKILALDDETVIAISGAFARSVEVCRFLQHSFKYFKRMNLQEMSLEGKLMEISRALAGNAPMAAQGIGLFLPIVAAYDKKADRFSIYFFDGAGARFENGAYACAGSGSERIRGVFEFIARDRKPWPTQTRDEALRHALTMLDIAADLDSATGGFTKALPVVWLLDRQGARPADPSLVQSAVAEVLG
ncbi:MAG: hypothetical protein KIS66_06420 [Fimbriimonadaceae bacterium]|nr:hypothetical protein [Fimbriimonadaceae bacterium]